MHPFINILGYKVQSYWLFQFLAIITGISIILIEAKRKHINLGKTFLVIVFIFVIGYWGARIYYYLFTQPKFIITHPLKLIYFWSGGLAVHGGILAGIFALIVSAGIFKISFWKLGDTFALATPLSQAIGRIGCFLNGCCYGLSTQAPWAVTYTNPDAIAPIMVKLHPTQLYEVGGDFTIFLVLLTMRKKIKYEGEIFLFYLIGYSIVRFIISFYRADSLYLGNTKWRMAHLISIITIISCLIIIKYLKKKINKT